MNIDWNKQPKTTEEIIISTYINDKISFLEKLFSLYNQEGVYSISFTSNPLNGDFYTCEIKYHQHDKKYIINIWKGVRTGDTFPILYGYLIQ